MSFISLAGHMAGPALLGARIARIARMEVIWVLAPPQPVRPKTVPQRFLAKKTVPSGYLT